MITPAPEPKKTSDVEVLDASVRAKSPAPSTVEVGGDGTDDQPSARKDSRKDDVVLETPAGAPRQQPSAEGGSTTGTSQGRVLLHPPRSVIEAELIEDPMLSAESLKNFQDTFKDLYRFSTSITSDSPWHLKMQMPS